VPGPDPSGHDDRQAMDSDVLALVQQAEQGIHQLLQDPQEPADWDTQLRCLQELQAIAAMLVSAARLHAEHLSQHAGGQIDRPAKT